MWGYQTHFRSSVSFLANEVLKRIAAGDTAAVLLVGVRRPGREVRHAVCVEPEDGSWKQALFDGVDQEIERAIPGHSLQEMFYGDEPRMRDKPENIRRTVVKEEIERRIASYDQENGTLSFCGSVYPVDDYYVCTIIQVNAALLDRFPPVKFAVSTRYDPSELSFIKSCIETVLDEARNALVFPEPGRGLSGTMRSSEEVVARAASGLMRSISFLIGPYEGLGLFEAFNQIAALKYEGTDVNARLLLISGDVAPSAYLFRFADPVRLSQSRWARKLLHLVTRDAALVGDSDALYGITTSPDELSESEPKSFTVEFLGGRQWILYHRSQGLLRVEAGQAQLPQEPISVERFTNNVERIFVDSGANPNNLWQIFLTMLKQPKGHMVVVAADAIKEAERLASQGTRIHPTPLTSELLERACRIDGTILIDPQGVCHAIGIILDGPVSEYCTPSRGARYNSAIRYVGHKPNGRMAIVISDDASIDIIPMLRPRLAVAEIEGALAALATSTRDNYHKPRLFLDENRFYLSAEQCDRANAAIDRLSQMPMEVGRIYIMTKRFSPDPLMDASYLY